MSRELDPVRTVITQDTVLADLITNDGVALEDGDDVLVAIPGSTKNGPYTVVEDALWYRRWDWEQQGQMLPHSHLTVLEGNVQNGSSWYFSNPAIPTMGVTVLNWEQRDYGTTVSGGDMLEIDPATGQLVRVETGVDPGDYTSPTMTINEFGDVVAAEPGTVPVTFIEGLNVTYLGSNGFTVRSGAAWIPGLEIVLDLPDDYPKIGNLFSINSTYYIYFYQNVNIADYEFSTQKPASPYRGLAALKGGPNNTTPDLAPDDTRRAIGTFQTDASGNVIVSSVQNIGAAGQASTTDIGLIELADQNEVNAGADAFRAVTPATLQGRTALESRSGILRIATQSETNAGVDDTKAVSPLKLGARIATETSNGFTEIATQAETDAGTDNFRYITPLKLASRTATETRTGIARVATTAEVNAGTLDNVFVTPLKFRTAQAVATETAPGIAEIATQAETDAGSDDQRFVTPAKMRASVATTTRPGVAEIATVVETETGTDDTRYVTPKKMADRNFFLIGEIRMWAGGNSDPAGGQWFICDGRQFSRVNFPDLFATIGTSYGAGNGTTTFNIPDFRGKSPMGANVAGLPGGSDPTYSTRTRGNVTGTETHAMIAAEMPSHNHGGTITTDSPGTHSHATFGVQANNSTPAGGTFNVMRGLADAAGGGASGTTGNAGGHTHSATIPASGSGTAHPNVHPVQVTQFIIRAAI